MGMTNLLPSEGVWELRLGRSAEQPGVYLLSLYDKKVATQGGPFPLRFPSNTYAVHWFDQLIIDGTRSPADDRGAEAAMESSWISAQGSSSVWGPIVNALFHSVHSGPHLASPWWYGSSAPFVDTSPLAPPEETQASSRPWIQVFTDINTGTVVAIRNQIGDPDSNVQFLWWMDDHFQPEMPPEVGGGRQFTIYAVDLENLEHAAKLLDARLPYPKEASAIFSGDPSALISSETTPLELDELIGRLLNGLTANSLSIESGAAAIHLKQWLSSDHPVPAGNLVAWITDLMVQTTRAQHDEYEKEEEDSPFVSIIESDAFHEVLVGPDAEQIFALHYLEASRTKGAKSWHVDNHCWRVNGDWDDDFPEYEDDWRWLAENERLAGIPDVVQRIMHERGREEEFMLAWDVCDSLRIHDDYVEEFTELFDLPIDLPSGLAHWLQTDPTEIVDPVPLERDSDPMYQVALLILSRATKHSTHWPADDLTEPLWSFVSKREPRPAGDITTSIMKLLRWFHDSDRGLEGVTDAEMADAGARIDPTAVLGTDRLVKFVSALVALTDDIVVINVTTERYPDGIYVQLCREDDGALSVEAVSSKFLKSPLTPDEISTLHSLGWEDPLDEELPNYIRYLEPGETSPGEVAEFLVKTLQSVYGTKPSDLHQFAPECLFRELIGGFHGPEYAMNPDLSEAQEARLFLGIRFPIDLNWET